MKKVFVILGLALTVITVCMIVLVFKGVSLRTEPIIKPSPIDAKYENISYGIFHRMYPSFQSSDYVLWNLNSDIETEEGKIFQLLQAEYTKQLHQKPSILVVTEASAPEEIKGCVKPCWLVVSKSNSVRSILGENYFAITILDFERDMAVPEGCEQQHRIEIDCILPISVREARRFMKEPATRYFFMRRYNEKDYYLFLEKTN